MANQKITPGGSIDAATPAEVAALIAQAFTQQGVTEYRRLKGAIVLNAQGVGLSAAADIVVPSEYDMLLERVAFGGTGAANALIGVYENEVSDLNLLEVAQLGTAGKYSDGFSNTTYVTANSVILIAVTGGVAGLQVTYNIQARLRHRRA